MPSDEQDQKQAQGSARVRLAQVRETALDVAEVTAAVQHPAAGGIDVFIGVVRDHDGGRCVQRLGYQAHPTAAQELARVCAEVAARHDLHAVAAVHRVGALKIGDLAVVVATSASHRDACFAATRDLIDTLKQQVPIWKQQHFDDGGEEWVGTP